MSTPEILAETLAALEDRHGGSLMARRPLPPVACGAGAWVWDVDGNRYLDLTSAYGVASLGHAPPALAAALAEQAAKLVSCPGNLYCEARAGFLARLHRVLPARLSRSFLCNSGAEALEAALKFSVLATGRRRFVALRGSFHGRTFGALAVTWSPPARRPLEGFLPEVAFVGRADVEALDAAIDDETAAVVVEVVQGEGGVHPLEESFLRSAQRWAHERGALFVVDEIQTGFGRTGAWFSHVGAGLGSAQGHGLLESLAPDIVTLAKGIAGGFPLGAAVYTEQVAAHLAPNVHASTFGANPLACAAGEATLRTLEAEELPARAAVLGAEARAELRAGLQGVPLVREVRGRGLMIGIELRKKAGPFLARLLREHQLLTLPAGPTVLRLLPPLVIDEEDLRRAVETIVEVLRS